MASAHHLASILMQNKRLTRKDYQPLLDGLHRNPDALADITSSGNRDLLLDLVVSYSDRLATFIDRVHTEPPSQISERLRKKFAGHLIELIVGILPELCDILEDIAIVELLAPLVTLCVTRKLSCLQKLASSLSSRPRILQTLSANKTTGEKIQAWTKSSLGMMPRNSSTLEAWTRTLVCMADNCQPDFHQRRNEIESFNAISTLSTGLEQFDRESVKARSRTRQMNSHKLPGDLKASLAKFGIQIPHSSRMIQQAIEDLRIEKTMEILEAVGSSFPCQRCGNALAKESIPTVLSLENPILSPALLNIDLEVFGKQVGTWKVVFSQAALEGLRTMDKPEHAKIELESLSKMCAKFKRADSGKPRERTTVPLWEVNCGQDVSILWQVDIGFNNRTRLWQQEIKVWDIGDGKQISKTIYKVMVINQNYSDEKINQCNEVRNLRKNSLPMSFETHSQQRAERPGRKSTLHMQMLDQETIDLANKFYTLTEPVLRSVMAHDISAQFPLDISAEEEDIIGHFQSSSLILGRSGTGKTTCLVYKLVGKYLASIDAGHQPIRQVLMTRSSHLAQKLQSYTIKLIHTIQTKRDQDADQTATDTNTCHEFDHSSTETALTLQRRSLPLICTFDGFLSILENTVRAMDRQNFEPSRRVSKIVDYDKFRLDYWPHFPPKSTKSMSVALVFSEIMGVIKGCASSSESCIHMSREVYEARSDKNSSNLTIRTRSDLYDLFKHYESVKAQRREQDYVDRVVKLLASIRGNDVLRKLLSSTFNELYIDEVQDQRTIDIELFLSFIKDSRGFHFAGDTAQAIAQDATFRFADISALIYRHFSAVSNATNQVDLAKPKLFKLAKNYRSHQAILRLASRVMNLIWNGFPETVDKLSPEVGQLFGPIPTLFLGCSTEILIQSNAGGVKLSENTAEFGAEQVILVRDDDMKKELQDQIGDAALVLTILQSKGMEFDDVILWDFFSRIPNPTAVRRIKELMAPDTALAYASHFPEMCSELKKFYVAITRARIQFFLIERSETTMNSVLDIFRDRGTASMVDITRQTDDSFADKLQCLKPGQSVDLRRWSLRGEQFMHSSNFAEALFCYRKGENLKGQMEAQAEVYAEEAKAYGSSGDLESSLAALLNAKNLFIELDLVGKAAALLQLMGQLKQAAEIWVERGFFGKAADLYCQACLWPEAADCYEKHGNADVAAIILRRENLYDKLVTLLSNNRDRMNQDSYQRFIRLCKVLLKQGRISAQYREHAINLLGSTAEQEMCFREYEMHEELLRLFKTENRHIDAFSLELQLGKLEDALENALEHELVSADSIITESQISFLMDYILMEKAIMVLKAPQEKKIRTPRIKENLLSAQLAIRLSQWKVASHLFPWESSDKNLEAFKNLKQEDMKAIVSLLNILYSDVMAKCSKLQDLPYILLSVATDQIQNVIFKRSSMSEEVLMMICGVRIAPLFGADNAPLQWSPLFAARNSRNNESSSRAESFACTKLSSAILKFESKAESLRSKSEKKHCASFLVYGRCATNLSKGCDRVHELVSPGQYTQNLTFHFAVVNVLCGLTTLYYRRILPQDFQKMFLIIKRRWLESLLRRLNYTSAHEQDFQALSIKRAELIRANRPTVISAAIEDLLFYRIRTNWEERKVQYRLLEDTQIADLLGRKVATRLQLARSFRFHSIFEKQNAFVLNRLKQAIETRKIESTFQKTLTDFANVLLNPYIAYVGSIYTIVTELESLAAFLILKQLPDAALMPFSWITRNCSWLSDSGAFETSNRLEKDQYLPYLLWFAQKLPGFFATYQDYISVGAFDVLKQRASELLAVVWINLEVAHPRPRSLNYENGWAGAIKAFNTAVYCKFEDYNKGLKVPEDLYPRLSKSFSRYHGNEHLVLFNKEPGSRRNLHIAADVKIIVLDDLAPYRSSQTQSVPSKELEQYTAADMAALTKFQKRWRFFLKIRKDRQPYLKTSKARSVAKYIALGPQRATSLPIRAILVSKGPEVDIQLFSFKSDFTTLRNAIVSEIATTEGSNERFELLDKALHNCTEIEKHLLEISTLVLDSNIQALIQRGNVSTLNQAFSDASQLLQTVEIEMRFVRGIASKCKGAPANSL